MTFPIGAIVAGVIAGASSRPTRAKANVVGARYVLELPNQTVSPGVGVATILGLEGLFAGLLVIEDPAASDVLNAIAVVALLLGALIALLALVSTRFIAFDDQGLCFPPGDGGREFILFRGIASVRLTLLRTAFVFRTTSGDKLRIAIDLHGFATLARVGLDNLPESVRMSRRTRVSLERLAQLDRS